MIIEMDSMLIGKGVLAFDVNKERDASGENVDVMA